MSFVTTKWREFKTNLTTHYIYGKYKNKSPCGKYFIDEETWSQFVQSRTDPKWEVGEHFIIYVILSYHGIHNLYMYDVLIGKEEVSSYDCTKSTTPHILSRGGYDLLEKRMVEEKLKRQQAEFGFAELITPPSSPSRHEKWKLAITKPGDQMTYEKSLELIEAIGAFGANSPFSYWFFLILLSLFLQPPLCLVVKAPSIAPSCLMALLSSCACKAFKSSARETFDRSFVFSRVVMVASNLSITVTSSFSTTLESFNTDPSNLTLLAMLRSLSEYSFTDSDSFILCSSNSLIRFSTCIRRILSSPSYSALR